MKCLNRNEFREQMNECGRSKKPCLFIADFEGSRFVVAGLNELERMGISVDFGGVHYGRDCCGITSGENLSSLTPIAGNRNRAGFIKSPVSFEEYKKGFDYVMERLKYGDTYLLNLTYPTVIECNESPELIYCRASAPYKMLYRGEFLFYSPEPFIKIEDGVVYSFPMKGTIDARSANAAEVLLGNRKELFEHYTIVDLIRNDLAMIARGIRVESFRYIEPVRTHYGEILQTSSRISGSVDPEWRESIGDMLLRVLPAGSISGAPKERTLEIIRRAEICERGFYTGVAGIFDGNSLNSCVIIRFMEICGEGRYIYHSGGGITAMSSAEEEYAELISKIYVPVI